MSQLKSFFKTTLLGGLLVILPATVIVAVFIWLYLKVTRLIQPLTDQVLRFTGLPEVVADLIVVTVIVTFCFLVGLIMKMRVFQWLFEVFERRVLTIAPGYNMVKETVNQLLGRNKSPFGSVALVQLYESHTLATAFVTDEHDDGSYTVFVPTGPNPTSGQIFHLEGQYVHPVDVGVDTAMRSIISCGAGSSTLVDTHVKKTGGWIPTQAQ